MISRACFAFLCLVVAASCTTPKGPTESDAVFLAELPAATEVKPNLRYAIVWVESSRVRALDGGRVRGTPFDVRVEWPASVRPRELQPIERMLVAESTGQNLFPDPVYANVYRPRVALYRDLDDDQELTLSETSADKVIANDTLIGIAALLDPKVALEQLTLEQSRQFYADGHAYGRFLLATDSGYDLRAASGSPLFLFPGAHAERREDILCGRSVVFGSAAAETRFLVDDSLDQEMLCPPGVSECLSESLEALRQPGYESDPDVERYPLCRRTTMLASFAVFSQSPECDACACSEEPLVEVYLAAHDSLPSWWPCGDALDYCDDGADVTSLGFCTAFSLGEQGEQEADAGARESADAGL